MPGAGKGSALMQFYLLEDVSHGASTVPGTLKCSRMRLHQGLPGSCASGGSFGGLQMEGAGSDALVQALSQAGCMGLSSSLGQPLQCMQGDEL